MPNIHTHDVLLNDFLLGLPFLKSENIEIVKDIYFPELEETTIKIYTETNCYRISAFVEKYESGEIKKTYLGCIANSRKPRAGEEGTRGNDLPDGPFTRETWQKILAHIVGYELVKVHKKHASKS